MVGVVAFPAHYIFRKNIKVMMDPLHTFNVILNLK